MRSGAECDSAAGSASPHLAPDDESTSGAPHCLAPAASLTARYRACRLLRDAAHLKRCAAGHRRHALTFGQASHPTGPTVSSTGYKLAVLHWYARPGELQPVHPNPPAWREPWAAAALRLLTLTHLCSLCSVERRRSESSQWAAEQAGAAQSPTAAESGSGRRRRCMRSRDRARALCCEPCACNAACASARSRICRHLHGCTAVLSRRLEHFLFRSERSNAC